jgi:hypothetical protein
MIDHAKDDSREYGESLVFAAIKASIEKDSRVVVSYFFFWVKLCVTVS